MNIYLSTNSLSADEDTILCSGALYGLQYLQQMEHRLFFDADKLSAQQQNLLKNEHIEPESPDFDNPDLRIVAKDGLLKAINSEDSIIESAENWIILSKKICFPSRRATISRKTAETNISAALNLDGSGKYNIDTGLDFLDHMLEQIAKHGLIDLELSCAGDLEVDEHHTIEDVAITLGQIIDKALEEKVGIQRYGFTLPMDESLATVALDLSGRPYLVFEGVFEREMVGDFPTEMVEHFFYSLAMNLNATLNIDVKGENDHHKIEACFKSFAHCLRSAVSRSERNSDILPSTKELL